MLHSRSIPAAFDIPHGKARVDGLVLTSRTDCLPVSPWYPALCMLMNVLICAAANAGVKSGSAAAQAPDGDVNETLAMQS